MPSEPLQIVQMSTVFLPPPVGSADAAVGLVVTDCGEPLSQDVLGVSLGFLGSSPLSGMTTLLGPSSIEDVDWKFELDGLTVTEGQE
mmetsp:Transcript_53619/g.107452  ORF Transcript_53619/g.107452 Transcript_53619/m.107452 type:complete len:87 (+) Transcript_53619:98-358(+)